MSQTTIPLGNEFNFTLEVEWDAAAGEYDFEWPELPACDKLEIVGNSSASQRRVVGDKTIAIKRFEYRLKPVVTGKAVIEPVKIEFRHQATGISGTERTRFIDVQITKPNISRWDFEWILIVLALGGVVAIAVGVVVFLKARPQRHKPEPVVIQEKEPEDQVLGQLQEYEKMRMEGELKDYCITISRVLKQFIQDKYKLSVKNLLTDEVLDRLRQAQVPDQVCVRMKSIFELSDVIKYSTGQPGAGEAERLKTMVANLMQDLK